MTCQPLPDTGLSEHFEVLMLAGITCLVVGSLILLARRSRGTRLAVAVVILVTVVGAVAVSPGRPAEAASDCVSAENSLTITQTSVIDGIAPGIDPLPIRGFIVNNGPDGTRIAVIEVAITSVTNAPDVVGGCDASDYRLIDPMMVVDRHLGPGASTPFAGASIEFEAKSTNQDACKRAKLHLRYTARR